MKKIFTISTLFLAGFLFACKDNGVPEKVDGWKPVYKTDVQNAPIESIAARGIENGGKIYIKGSMLYQVEKNKGVHVIDVSNPSQPQKIAFLTISGASEISILNNYLYSNNYNDMIVVDIANIHDIKLVKRIANVFSFTGAKTPPQSGYFECVDDNKGVVVDWQYTTLTKPKCKL